MILILIDDVKIDNFKEIIKFLQLKKYDINNK